MQHQTLPSGRGALEELEGVHGASDVSHAIDNSMQYLTYMLFDRLQHFVLNYSLNSDGDTWSEPKSQSSQEKACRWVLACLPPSVESLLGVQGPCSLAPAIDDGMGMGIWSWQCSIQEIWHLLCK